MPSAVALVIYLSAAEAANPATAGMLRSAREVLGSQARLTILESDARVSDAALAEGAAATDGAAQVSWLDSNHREVAVRLYIERDRRFTERHVSFDDEADPDERERMLGFVIASMLPAAQEADVEPRRSEPARLDEARSRVRGGLLLSEGPRTGEGFVGLAEVVGLAATGFGGAASGIGAAVAGRWLFARSLSLRLAAGFRRGEIPKPARRRKWSSSASAWPRRRRSDVVRGFSVGGRVGALLLRHQVEHLSSDDPAPVGKNRLMPGADVLAEGSLRFSTSASLLVGVGAELAFGHTAVLVNGKEVMDIPLRGILELGIQAKF